MPSSVESFSHRIKLPVLQKERVVCNPVNCVVEPRCTSRQRNTHSTQSKEVCYPWHPWYGQCALIHETLVKSDKAVFRCSVELDGFPSALEVPQWMFDRALCCSMRITDTPVVGCQALLELQELLRSAGDRDDVIEGQHHSSNGKGDADVVVAGLSSCRSVEAVSSTSENAAVANPAVGGQTKHDKAARAHAAPARGRARRPQQRKGDER